MAQPTVGTDPRHPNVDSGVAEDPTFATLFKKHK